MKERPLYYALVDKKIVPCNSIEEYAEAYRKMDWFVDKTQIGKYEVSTVFLFIDHNFRLFGNTEPLLFETMIFNDGGSAFDYQERYCTWDEAIEGHKRAIEWLENELKTNTSQV